MNRPGQPGVEASVDGLRQDEEVRAPAVPSRPSRRRSGGSALVPRAGSGRFARSLTASLALHAGAFVSLLLPGWLRAQVSPDVALAYHLPSRAELFVPDFEPEPEEPIEETEPTDDAELVPLEPELVVYDEPELEDVPVEEPQIDEFPYEDWSVAARSTPPATVPEADPPATEDPVAAPAVDTTTAAILIDGPAPTYPRISVRLEEAGTVRCRIHVGPNGRVTDVEIVQSSGSRRLDDAAVDAILRWSFRPATRGGIRVSATLLHNVVFRLRGP